MYGADLNGDNLRISTI